MGPLTVNLYDGHLQDAFMQSSCEWICDLMLDLCSCSMLINSWCWIYSDEGCVTPWQLGLENGMITWRKVNFNLNTIVNVQKLLMTQFLQLLNKLGLFKNYSPVCLHGEEADAEEEEDDDEEEWQPGGRASPATGRHLRGKPCHLGSNSSCHTAAVGLVTCSTVRHHVVIVSVTSFFIAMREFSKLRRTLLETITSYSSNFLAHYRHRLNLAKQAVNTGRGKKRSNTPVSTLFLYSGAGVHSPPCARHTSSSS